MKFDLAKIAKLDDPARLDSIRPDVMWAALGAPAPRAIVEIGAGTGLFSAAFAGLAPEAVVYAADIEPSMLDWMSEHRPEVAEGRVVPVLATETTVPLADGGSDLVVMINLHHELDHPDATCAEALRLLAPGGQVLVADWADRETPKGPPASARVSADAIVGCLRSAGFDDVRSHPGLEWHSLVTGRRRG